MRRTDWDTIKHFSADEFLCKCGCGQGADHIHPDFITRLDLARDIAGIPFTVTSGYRCPEYNTEVGGVASSSHTRGYAADIVCHGSRSRAQIIQAAIKAKFTRIGIARVFVHLDCDPDKPPDVFWVY